MATMKSGTMIIEMDRNECWTMAHYIKDHIEHSLDHYKQYPRTWNERYAWGERRMLQMFFDLCDSHEYYDGLIKEWEKIVKPIQEIK